MHCQIITILLSMNGAAAAEDSIGRFDWLIAAVCAGSIAVGMDGSVRSKADVAHVAGALIRSALPMHYHITVNGGRI